MFDFVAAFCDDEIVKETIIDSTSGSDTSDVVNITTPRSQSRSMLPLMALIAIVALIVVGFAAYYLRTPSTDSSTLIVPSPTQSKTMPEPSTTALATEWKTYENTKHSFSIEYPSDWSVRAFESGASLNPLSMPGYPDKSDAISVSVGTKMGNYMNDSLEEYSKKAASSEIQNYGDLETIKKITTTDGTIGYMTTWVLQSFLGRDSGTSVSLPITYFELPANKTQLVRVTLDRSEDLEVYEKMLQTVKFKTSVAVSPTAPVDESSTLKSVIGTYIAQKSGGDASALSITVSKVEGNYARGMASEETSGGMWFAAKVGGAWKLVWDGNGIIQCADLTSYPDFPSSLIPECFDAATQTMITR